MWKIQHKGKDFDWSDASGGVPAFSDAWRILNFLQSSPSACFFQYRISKTFN